MKKLGISLLLMLVMGGIVMILMNNKSKMAAKSKNDTISAYPVSVVQVDRKPFSQSLSLVGTIAANKDVAVVSETQGRVTNLMFDIGNSKAAGAVLVQVDDELKKANLEMAEANFEKAKKDLQRYEMLSKEKTVTDVQYETTKIAYKNAETQLTIARRQFNDTKITTPISGEITARMVEVGSMIQPGMTIANIVDISTLKVKLNVAEKDVFMMGHGDKVEITTDVYPGVTFTGTIESISSKGDESHTYPVEIALPNSKTHPLRAGMFGRVNFSSIQQNDALMIPREALVGSIKKPQVYVVNNGKVLLRDIIVGAESGSHLEVVHGLNQGETVVTNGQNNLRNNYPVVVAQ